MVKVGGRQTVEVSKWKEHGESGWKAIGEGM